MATSQPRHTLATHQPTGLRQRLLVGVIAGLAVSASLATTACGPGPGAGAPVNPNAAAVDAALSELSPVTAGPDDPAHPVEGKTPETTVSEPLPDPTAESGRRRFDCTATPYSLTTTPDKIVMQNPDNNKLWVGGLLQGDGYANGPGSLLELPIRKRAPLKIFVDLLGNDVTATVDRPDAASVQQAVAGLVQKARAENVPIPSRASFDEREMDDTAEGLLKLGFSAKYLGASAKGELTQTRTAKEHSYLVSFYQRQFTVSMVTPERSSDLFSTDFTAADLQVQKDAGRISDDNPPVIVSSVSYGRVLLYSLTSSESVAKVQGALKAGFLDNTVEAGGEDERILKELRVKAVNIGGREADYEALLKSRKINDYFSGNSDLATAVPISYQLNNLVGKLQAASFNETTNYTQTTCSPIPNRGTIVGARVQITPPQAYLRGPRNPGWTYGNINVTSTGSSTWTVGRDRNDTIYLHTPSDLAWNQPDRAQAPWTVDLRLDQPVTIKGAMNCKLVGLEIGPDPSNQYNWAWTPNSGSYGDVTVDGGSRHCRIDLRTNITKIKDIYEYQP